MRERPKFSSLQSVGTLFSVMLNAMGPGNETALFIDEQQKKDLLEPVHWGTFDLLRGDPEVLKREVKRGHVHIATPGEPFGL